MVAAGEGIVAPAVTRRLIEEFAARPEAEPAPPVAGADGLTPREREVLACLADGLSNEEIAGRLDMAVTTAKTHVSRILAKLGVRSRVQAAILARGSAAGVVEPVRGLPVRGTGRE